MNPSGRRKLARAAPAAALLLAVTACSSDAPETTPSTASPGQQEPAAPTAASTTPATSPSASGRSTAMNIRLTVDGDPVAAALNDSATAGDFASLLPLTLDLKDFHQAEKIVDLPRRLSTSGAPKGAAPKAGDLGYYAPWGQLVLYYRDVPYADGIVILGHLADDRDTDRLATASRVTVETVR
ncbi:cyclophilin-like fold protein [Streptomyces prasinus]|uniref:cyclophilin-like fold protein n=1 Tax=Streptomyces prasinus TaxID=67345 RepID=UPI0033D0769F